MQSISGCLNPSTSVHCSPHIIVLHGDIWWHSTAHGVVQCIRAHRNTDKSLQICNYEETGNTICVYILCLAICMDYYLVRHDMMRRP